MATVILGSGIIGVSTAYYLSQHPSYDAETTPIYLIEATTQPFQSASGYAGGFLAKNWFSSSSASLGELSFRLHRELADEFDGRKRWGYARSTALSLSVDERGISGGKKVRGEDWLLEGTSRREATSNNSNGHKKDLLNSDGSPVWIAPQEGGTLDVISSANECAQVEPLMLCQFLLEKCEDRGVKILMGSRAVGLTRDKEGKIATVKVERGRGGGESFDLVCTDMLISAGAWTPRVFETLFPDSDLVLPIEPLAGHSVVVKSPRHTLVHDGKYGGDYAVFCAPGKEWGFAPEAFTRKGRDGRTEIYVAGLNSSSLKLPESADVIERDLEAIKELKRATVQLAGASKEGRSVKEDDLEVIREGLCFRPVAPGGKPILCRVNEEKLGKEASGFESGGVYIAAGHGPWGISLSLGTGKVMSEMMRGERTSAVVDMLGIR